MKKHKTKEKYHPTDSTQKRAIDDKVVKARVDETYHHEEANLKQPALKRKYSEQPPTKHNTHN